MILKISKYIDNSIKYILVALVLLMLSMSVINVVLRLFGISYSWIEPLVRHMVFSTAFLGATLATGSSKHIAIEILPKYFEAQKKYELIYWIQKLSNLISVVILYFLANSGYEFFSVEKKYGAESFLGLHSSSLVLIIPVGFVLMMIRSILNLLDFSRPIHKEEVLAPSFENQENVHLHKKSEE